MRSLFTVIFLSSVLYSCSNQLKLSNTEEADKLMSESKQVVYLERTPCYGKCPTYKVEIYANGIVNYEGIRFVDMVGTYVGLLDESDIEGITDKALELGYFEFEDTYPVNTQPPQDLPQTISMINAAGKTQRVVNKNYEAPEKLIELENYVDAVIKKC